MPTTSRWSRPVHHYGYVVDDLAAAARHWHAVAGVGPFLTLSHVRFDEFTVDGMPANFDHTAAFASYGTALIELQLVHAIDPPSGLRYFRPTGHAGLNHVSYAVDDAAAASSALADEGLPAVVRARGGDLNVTLHDATPTLGFMVEIHQDSAFLADFTRLVHDAAREWDGREPLRELALPGLEG